MTALPVIEIHEVPAGGTFTGAAPTGVVSGTTILDGRILKYAEKPGGVGGLFTAPALIGWTLQRMMFLGAGTTQVDLSLVDMDSKEYLVHRETAAPESFVYPRERQERLMVPPGWKLKVVSQGALTAAGRVAIHVGPGWVPLAHTGVTSAP